jgi:hypothetical protein
MITYSDFIVLLHGLLMSYIRSKFLVSSKPWRFFGFGKYVLLACLPVVLTAKRYSVVYGTTL